ncbi:hypothetical protein AB1K70_03445 [Bremerella sp. JC770]|uniref:hypothetical protein n=1 Tax=Bremerella sp. JC770 TaxID=3232137 RepID=UPI00345A2465
MEQESDLPVSTVESQQISSDWSQNKSLMQRVKTSKVWNSSFMVGLGHALQGIVGYSAARAAYYHASGQMANRTELMAIEFHEPSGNRFAEVPENLRGDVRTRGQAHIASQAAGWAAAILWPMSIVGGLVGLVAGSMARTKEEASQASPDATIETEMADIEMTHSQHGRDASNLSHIGNYDHIHQALVETGYGTDALNLAFHENTQAVAAHLAGSIKSVEEGLGIATNFNFTSNQDLEPEALSALQMFHSLRNLAFQDEKTVNAQDFALAVALLKELHPPGQTGANQASFERDLAYVYNRFIPRNSAQSLGIDPLDRPYLGSFAKNFPSDETLSLRKVRKAAIAIEGSREMQFMYRKKKDADKKTDEEQTEIDDKPDEQAESDSESEEQLGLDGKPLYNRTARTTANGVPFKTIRQGSPFEHQLSEYQRYCFLRENEKPELHVHDLLGLAERHAADLCRNALKGNRDKLIHDYIAKGGVNLSGNGALENDFLAESSVEDLVGRMLESQNRLDSERTDEGKLVDAVVDSVSDYVLSQPEWRERGLALSREHMDHVLDRDYQPSDLFRNYLYSDSYSIHQEFIDAYNRTLSKLIMRCGRGRELDNRFIQNPGFVWRGELGRAHLEAFPRDTRRSPKRAPSLRARLRYETITSVAGHQVVNTDKFVSFLKL